MKKKIFVLLMVVCMMVTFMPTFAFATEDAAEPSAPAQTETVQTEESKDAVSEEARTEEATEPEAETKTEETKKADEQPTNVEADKAEAGEAKNQAEPAEAVTEEPQQEEVVEEKPDFEFTPEQADYLSYDPLYFAKYLNKKYVDVEEVEMSRFVNVVTAARGVATYNIRKQSDFEVTETNFLAGMNYEMPVYDLDDNSKYYVAIPNVNKFNGNFKAYDLMLTYNNDNGENIKGWKYEKGILYIPKSAVDNPKNREDISETAKLAIQLNYAIGSDMDFSKKIPVQILNGSEPKSTSAEAENIFDVSSLTVKTGVKGRKAEDVSVFLNGQLIPIYSDSFRYDKESGEISINALPGVVSNVNVVFRQKTTGEKLKDAAVGVIDAVTPDAYATVDGGRKTQAEMKFLKNAAGNKVNLAFDVSKMFVGWRGSYDSKIYYKNATIDSVHSSLPEFDNSVGYLYNGYTAHWGADFDGASKTQKDQWLVPTWAIQSYAMGSDVGMSTNNGTFDINSQVTFYNENSSTMKTQTIYAWMTEFANTLSKSNGNIGSQGGNGIGGSNNFAAKWPVNKVIKGSARNLSPNGTNQDMVFATAELDANSYFAASCTELDTAATDDEDGDIFVTCLGMDLTSAEPYIVLAMVNTSKKQNMSAIYKFGVDVGYVRIVKTQKQTETDFLTEAPNNYQLGGAQYELYKSDGTRATDLAGNPITFTTKADGTTDPVAVQTGDYYAVETVAPKGFRPDPTVQYNTVHVAVTNTIDNPASIQSVDEPTSGVLVSLRKINKKGDYGWRRMLGAEYTLSYYDVDPSTTDVSGQTAKRSWVFKTVEKVNPQTGESYAGIDFANDTPVSQSNFYTVKGVEGDKADGHAAYMHVDLDDTKASIRTMPCGVFTIQETKAPSGMAKNKNVYYGKVYQPSNGAFAKTEANTKGESTMTIEVGSENDVVNDEDLQSVAIKIAKYDKETDTQEAQGADRDHVAGSLAGAEYEVYYDDDDLGAPELVGIITTDADGNGILTKRELGDERFLGQDLKLGSYLIKEVTASPGYVLDKFYLNGEETEEVPDGEIEVICDYERDGTPVTKTLKGTYEDGKHLFRARAEVIDANLFTHTIKSEETPHHTPVYKTDATTGKELPGATLQVLDSKGNVVEQWVSTDKPHDIVALHDETQGLKDGKYTLREITAPYGYDVAEDVEFEVSSKQIVNKVKMENKPITIGTTATDTETETHQGVFKEESKIKDVVKITGLYAGRTYKVMGRLMDKATGEVMKDDEGNDITAESEEFVPTEDNMDDMEVELTFTVDSSKFTKDTTVVAFERLVRVERMEGRDETNDFPGEEFPKELQKHEDIEDEGQTIHYGGIVKTTALDKASKSHNILAGKDAVIVDTVEYKNLSTKEVYIVSGELFDKTTGQLLGVKGETKFTPKTVNGTVEVEFKLDASALENHDLVVFEKLAIIGHKDGKDTPVDIDEHKDPEDEEQTMHIPEIRTNATDVKTADHIALAEETVSIRDVVTYKNLIPGKTYTMNGTLMNKETGKPIQVNGQNVVASQTFTPTQKDGSVEIIFVFNGVDLAGTTTVAFEECTINKVPVAVHADLNDAPQTVDIPKIGTKVGKVKGKKVVDTVTYENLIPGRTYVMRGWLVKKSNGKKISGSEGEIEFTPTAPNGKVEVTLYTDNMKSDAVAFEECYMKATVNGTPIEVKVGEHKDPKDKKQTVRMTPKGPKTGDNSIVLYGLASILATALATIILNIKRRKIGDLE